MNGFNLTSIQWNERTALNVSYVIVAAMMALVMALAATIGRLILPSWSNGYLVLLGFVVALEAIYFKLNRRRIDVFSAEWVVLHLSEWVVICLVIKLLLYVAHGWRYFLEELPTWRVAFLEGFLTPEYITACFLAILVWFLSTWFFELLAPLRDDVHLLLADDSSRVFAERYQVRQRLANLILGIGMLMVFLTAGLRTSPAVRTALGASGFRIPTMRGGIVIVVLYFMLGLALLSLTQFSYLRIRWGLNQYPIKRNLARQWAGYSFGFLLVLALLAFILPTSYSLDLLSLFNVLAGIAVAVLGFVAWLLMLPVILLTSLLGIKGVVAPQAPNTSPLIPPSAQALPATPNAWLELLKSLLFWGMILGLLVFSVMTFFRSRPEYLNSLRKLRLFDWGERIWKWLKSVFGQVVDQIAAAASSSMARMRSLAGRRRAASQIHFRSLHRLSPRQRVMFYYLAMVRRSEEQGLKRRPDQTPHEYETALLQTLEEKAGSTFQEPAPQEDVQSLTGQFVEARYSAHPITAEQAGLVKSAWERLRKILRRLARIN